MKKLMIIFLVFVLGGILPLMAQNTGKSPYPIIFVHGINSSDQAWYSVIDDDGNQNQYGTDLQDVYGEFHSLLSVYHAVLNAEPTSTKYQEDVVVNFAVNDALYSNGSIFAINFETSLDANGNLRIHNADNGPGQSAGNESAIVKQGYALSLMIDKVLTTTGSHKVILVGHSMGGLAIREYLQRKDGLIRKWWVRSGTDGHRVAKVVTIGTPHAGSNAYFQGLIGIDPKSEATRDLTWDNATSQPEWRGTYLFGGSEFFISSFYYNKDVDCSGFENEDVVGLNMANTFMTNPAINLPVNIEYTWITSDWLTPDGDIAVDLKRQWVHDSQSPPQVMPFGISDTLFTSVLHNKETEDLSSITRGLDEPDTQTLAYGVELNTTYAGLITYQPHMATVDFDYYRFENLQQGIELLVLVNGNDVSGVTQATVIYPDASDTTVTLTSEKQRQKITIPNAQTGTYYLKVKGMADLATFLTPYTFMITDAGLIGYYSDGWHDDGTSQAFVDAHDLNGGDDALGEPDSRGPGGEYVHPWPNDMDDPYSPLEGSNFVWIQDFKNYSNGFESSLVYNPDSLKAFPVSGAIANYWFSNSGLDYRYPMSNEIAGTYVYGSYAPNGTPIVVQRFGSDQRGRKTIVHNPAAQNNSTTHTPMGEIKFNGVQGDKWYVEVNGIEHYLFEIDASGTGKGWMEPGTYTLIRRDANGVLDASYVHTVIEGNHQESAIDPNAVQPPVNIVLTSLSDTQIKTEYQDPNNPPGFTTYEIDRDNGADLVSTSDLNYTFTGLTPGTVYTFKFRSKYNGTYSVWSKSYSHATSGGNPPPSTDPAHLAVHVTPSNATVLLDGSPFTTSPDITNLQYYDITANVNHTLTASAPGYEDYTQSFALGIGDYRDEVIFLNPTDTGQSSTSTNSDSLVFNPIHDQQVDFKDPTYLHGGAYLQVNHDHDDQGNTTTERIAYFKFMVEGIKEGEVENARLELYCPVGSNATLTLYETGNYFKGQTTLWHEDSLTGNNAPSLGASVSSVNSPANDTVVSFTIPASSIPGDGLYSFAIGESSVGGGTTSFSSKDLTSPSSHVYVPKLTVNYIPYDTTTYGAIVLTDTFETTLDPDWYINYGTVETVNGELHIYNGSTHHTGFDMLDGSVEFDLRYDPNHNTGDRVTGIVLRRQDDDNYYSLRLFRGDGRVEVVKMVNSNWTNVIYEQTGPLDPGRYRFTARGDSVYFENVGETGTSVYLTGYDNTLGSLPTGNVGFWSSAEHSYIDSVVVIDGGLPIGYTPPDSDSSASQQSGSTVLTESFDDSTLADWTTVYGLAEVVEGELHVHNGSVYPNNVTVLDGSVEFDLRYDPDYNTGALVSGVNIRNIDDQNYYSLRLFRQDGRVEVVKKVNNQWINIIYEQTGPLDPGRYKFTAKGDRVYFENVGETGTNVYLTGYDTSLGSLGAGQIRLWCSEEHSYFDNVVVKDESITAKRGNSATTSATTVPPSSYALHQNYPNPFNPETTIRYDLPEASRVTLSVYNMLGKEIIRLVDSNMPTGTHTVRWNGKDKNGSRVPSGIYFYTLETKTKRITKKMLLMK